MRVELYGCRARGLYIFFTTGRGLSVLKRFRETFGAFKLLRLVKEIHLHHRLIVVFVSKTPANPRIHACLRTSLFWYRLKRRDPFNQNSDRSDREKRTTSKGGPVFSKLFRLDRTDPLSFGPKFPEILVEWIAPKGLVNVVLYERETNAVWARGWR